MSKLTNGVTNSRSSDQSSSADNQYLPLIERIHKRQNSSDFPFFSLEFFPPKTKEAAVNLISRFDRFRRGGPLFCDITWHAAGNPGSDSETSSITIAGVSLNYCGLETMLHITCVGLTEADLQQHLERAKALGIRNILALRGDITHIKVGDFPFASDLVLYIRQKYGKYFTIAVAGYPGSHPESPSPEIDLKYLKDKVESGADFIITQLFFKAQVFIDFVLNCRKIGICVPILAGIMPIQSYDSLEKMVKLSKLDIPENIISDLKTIRGDDEAVRKYGIDWTVNLCKELIEAKVTPGLHFYTLNRELATTAILKQLELWCECPKPLPWMPPANHRRCSEDVRPIFWSGRPKSYVCRTQTWDEFPNGRWGRADSPAFTDLKDYYLFLEPQKSKKHLLQMWGKELKCEEDVWDVFYCYVSGKPNKFDKIVSITPWNTEELRSETNLIVDQLAKFNKRGILTINSQPNVNGVESTHPIHGWGASDGYIYQKAYLEFFTSMKNIPSLKEALKQYPLVNYQIVDSSGQNESSNSLHNNPIAVTWGVFPGKEIIQPTVVDPISFKVWKDEAFSLWHQKWAQLYEEDNPSKHVLNYIHENYYLVNLVDNQFTKECCLWSLLDQMFSIRSETFNK